MESPGNLLLRSDLNTAVSDITSFEKTPTGINGFASCMRFEVSIVQAGIIRVRVSRFEEWMENPYLELTEGIEPEFDLQDNKDEIIIKTTKVKVVIGKWPFRIKFYSAGGQLLSEDDPSFGISWIGTEVTNYKVLQEGERFIGLGEKTGPLDRRGKAYVNWNTDYFAYGVDADPLYMSTPFYMGLHHQQAYGIYFNNTHKTTFNFGASNERFSYFSAENGDLDYFFIHDSGVADIIRLYSDITGKMPLPPLWSLGFQQCRYSYYPDSEVLSVARQFREKDLPADVIYLDIHYMEKYKVFTFDKERFPDPAELCQRLKKLGFKVVVILDPGIKIDETYTPYLEGLAADLFVQYPDKTPYVGSVWPGRVHFPDFTKALTRNWWSEKISFYTELGISGFWNDMNEPSAWGQHIPPIVQFHFEGREAGLKEARNVYGLQMARSTFEGALSLTGKRPFNLTRAGFSGIQQYAAVWTGDNVASDEHMLAGIRLINSLGLTGVAYCGFDLGGFAGEASPALYARWISIAAFTPFFRGHSMINSRDAEPWAFGEEVEEISRNYLKLRYKLIPYIYACMHEASLSGMPLNRSLAIDYSFDEKAYEEAFQNQFLFGPSFLVAPVESTKEITKVYLPEGEWFQFFSGEKESGGKVIYADCGLGELPVYIKAGSIIPMQTPVSHLHENPKPVLHLHVYPGQNDFTFHYYEDDGESFGYQTGAFYSRSMKLQSKGTKLTLEEAKGNYQSKFDQVKIYFYGLRNRPGIQVNGAMQRIRRETVAHLCPISEFDPLPQSPKKHLSIPEVVTISIPFLSNKIEISWK
jgi:alpha-glucosidase